MNVLDFICVELNFLLRDRVFVGLSVVVIVGLRYIILALETVMSCILTVELLVAGPLKYGRSLWYGVAI